MILKEIKKNLGLYTALVVLVLAEVYFRLNYYGLKGDIHSINSETLHLLRIFKNEGVLEFLNTVFFHKLDKGTSTLIVQFPLFAMGAGTFLSNKILCIFFCTLTFLCMFRFFRFFAGTWASIAGAACLLSHEVIFKNINEYETFLVFLGSFSALLLSLGYRFCENNYSKKNAFFIALTIFLCVSTRPFESFMIMIGALAWRPSLLKHKAIFFGLMAGGLWWLTDISRIKGYWASTNDAVVTGAHNWSPRRFFDYITYGTFFLFISSLTAKQKFKNLFDQPSRMGMLAAGLNVAVLISLKYVEDDYLLIPFFITLALAIRFVVASEDKAKIKWRSMGLMLLAAVYIFDQAMAVHNGLGPLEIGRRVDRVDLNVQPVWEIIKEKFDKTKKYKVALIYSHNLTPEKDVRPAWGVLQSLAWDEGYLIEFDNPDSLRLDTNPRSDKEFCDRKFSYVLAFVPLMHEYEVQYYFDSRNLEPDFYTKHLKGKSLAKHYVPSSPNEGVSAAHVDLYEVCKTL